MYDRREHDRAIEASNAALALHKLLKDHARRAPNPAVEKKLDEAADALDDWIHDYLTKGVHHVIEVMEEVEAQTEYQKELHDFHSSYGRQL